MSEKKDFCKQCNDDVVVSIHKANLQGSLKGTSFNYTGVEKHSNCGHNIEDDEVERINQKALYDLYRTQNHLISLEQIQELPKKYDIGKRPLSILLGWGELTFSRYYDGDMPSKAYSAALEELYENPIKYLEILEHNKDLISPKAYEKSKQAVGKLLLNPSKISTILNYILYSCKDITPLAAQKLLYYTQGFYYAFFGELLFADECIASPNGPLFLENYEQFKNYIYCGSEVNKHLNDFDLSHKELSICKSVCKNFGCFSGDVLSTFTKAEKPWLSAIGKGENALIEKSDMFEFFSNIIQNYNIDSPLGIKTYALATFELI